MSQPSDHLDESGWQRQRETSALWYRQTFAGRLRSVTELIRQGPQEPSRMQAAIENTLHLLKQAQAHPDLLLETIELIKLVHPWPFRLGYWVSWEQALRFWIEACQAAGQLAVAARLMVDLGGILFHCGRIEEAINLTERALAIALEQEQGYVLVAALELRFDVLIYQHQIQEADALLVDIQSRPLLARFANEERAEVMAKLATLRAMLARHRSNFQEALRLMDEALDWMRPYAERQQPLLAHLHRLKGLTYRNQGSYKAAIHQFRRAALLFKRSGDRFSFSWALGNLGLVYWNVGNYLRSEAVTEYSIRVAHRLHARWQETCQVGNLALVYLSQGRLQAAERMFEKNLTMAVQIGLSSEIARAKGNLGIVKLHRGDYPTARDYLEQDRQATTRAELMDGQIIAEANLARCLALLGHRAEALDLAKQTVIRAQEYGALPVELVALRCLADCQTGLEAQDTLRHALSLTSDRPLDRAACLLSLAHFGQDVLLWEQGVTLLERIGATGWLHDQRKPGNPFCTPLEPPCIVALT